VRFLFWFIAAYTSALVLGALPRAAAQLDPAGAQEPDAGDPTGAYTQLVTRAVAAFDAERYLEARERMTRAHQLSPSARTLRGMGLAAFQAQHYSLAGIDFERALAESRNPLTDEQRGEIERLQLEASSRTARYRMTGQQPGAVIRIDQEPPVMDLAGFLVLDAGDHTLSTQPAGGDERTMVIHAQIRRACDADRARSQSVVKERSDCQGAC
jgi:tetratricopeptide (TPR) repeat protein